MPTLCYGIKNKILLHWSRIITSNSIIIGLLKTESCSIDLIPSGITMMHSEGWSPPNNQMTALGLTYEAMTPAHQWWWQPHVYNHGYSLEKKKNYACHDPPPPSIAVRARRSLTKLKVMYDLFSYTGFRLAVGLANCSVDFCIDYTDILSVSPEFSRGGCTRHRIRQPTSSSTCTLEQLHSITRLQNATSIIMPFQLWNVHRWDFFPDAKLTRQFTPLARRDELYGKLARVVAVPIFAGIPQIRLQSATAFFFFQRPQQVTCTNLTPRQPRRGIQARGTRCRKGDSEHDPWIAGLPGAGWWPACLPGPTLDERTLPVQARTGGSVQNAGVARTGFSKMEQSQLLAVPSILFFCYCSG